MAVSARVNLLVGSVNSIPSPRTPVKAMRRADRHGGHRSFCLRGRARGPRKTIGVELHIPPLRERPQDIEVIFRYYLDRRPSFQRTMKELGVERD
jgi:hypothetical protein